jgi:predicted Zn-dependent peptidase
MNVPSVSPRPADPAVRSTTLENGLTVVTELMPGSLSVTTGVWVGVGSRDEHPDQSGCSHFLEHLLFKGTDSRTALDIAQAIDAVGGEMNAYTTKEFTAFYTRTVAEDAALSLDILCDILRDPALRDDDVDSERKVILEEIAMRADEPADLVHDIVHEQRFGDHGLGRDTAGTVETVTATTANHIRAFMDSTYGPSAIVVAAAGKVDHDATVEQVRNALARPSTTPPPRSAPATRVNRSMIVPEDTEQAHLVVTLDGIARNDPDRFALAILDHVLGGGMSSRLFHEIREKRGLVYSVYSYRASYEDAGFMGVYAGTAPARVPEVLDLIAREFDRMRTQGIEEDEIRRAKSSVRGGTALGLEDSGSRMSRIGRTQLLVGEVPPIDWLLGQTDAVTSADINRVIERILAKPATLALVGPVDASVVSGHELVGTVG